MTDAAPEVSIVIPVYNESEILAQSVGTLCAALRARHWSFEVILAENGSTDATATLAAQLAEQFAQVRTFSYPAPNYGGALREGIARARGRFVICEEIDLCDVDFHAQAIELLRKGGVDMVVGSKAMRGARDTRPFRRRVATRMYNGVLRVVVGFPGTDTHGLKAFVAGRVAPIARACVVEHDVFASELVIRAHLAKLNVVEVPVEVREKRAPSIRLLRRVPRVLRNVVRLTYAIRCSSSSAGPARGQAQG